MFLKKGLILLLIGIFILPVACPAQDDAKIKEAAKAFYNDQHKKLVDFLKQQYVEQWSFLQNLLEDYDGITREQKQELINAFLVPFQEEEVDSALIEERSTNAQFFNKTVRDESLDMKQKAEALKNYVMQKEKSR